MSEHRPTHFDSNDQLDLFGGDSAAVAPPSFDRSLIETRRSARAKRLSLAVHVDGRIVLTAPRRASVRAVQAFVDEHEGWIVDALAEQAQHFPEVDRGRPTELSLSAVNEQWTLVRRIRSGRSLRCRVQPGSSPSEFVLTLDGDELLPETSLKHAVREHLKRRALAYFESVLPHLAADMGCPYKRVQVRAQRSRWGSYSTSGTISMNYAALFLEPELARYLCVHELAHVRHLDHSDAFWEYVDQFASPARELDRRVAARYNVLPGWLW